MLNDFNTYWTNTLNLLPKNSVLLAVSGGADSVAMLNLFSKTNFECGIAHCNFHLRNEESDKDALFVKELAKKYDYQLFTINFDTEKYATEKGISIEMAARELRYNWFEKIRNENNYDYIATAHHKNDVIETFFLNLARGTGIRGLSGIKAISGKLIRPIIFAEREQILDYINKNSLEYREDTSNKDVKIKRNKLRHDIIPQLAEINPAYQKNIIETIERLDITNEILKNRVNEVAQTILTKKGNQVLISIKKLKEQVYSNFFLFEILNPYGFNQSQIKDIINVTDGISGKIFNSPTHQIVKDREHFILLPIKTSNTFSIEISDDQQKIKLTNNNYLKIETFSNTENFIIQKQTNIGVLDKDKLQFPLEVRSWETGDYFYPIGMKQKKKLSDFFIDNKFSKIEKEKTLLLISTKKIVWIIGHRLDNRFKITDKTKNIIQITFETQKN